MAEDIMAPAYVRRFIETDKTFNQVKLFLREAVKRLVAKNVVGAGYLDAYLAQMEKGTDSNRQRFMAGAIEELSRLLVIPLPTTAEMVDSRISSITGTCICGNVAFFTLREGIHACDDCRRRSLVCRLCRKRHYRGDITSGINSETGEEYTVCRPCLEARGGFKCALCRNLSFTPVFYPSEEVRYWVEAGGGGLCSLCVRNIKKLDCGHFSLTAHRRTCDGAEDDNRLRDQMPDKYVCNECANVPFERGWERTEEFIFTTRTQELPRAYGIELEICFAPLPKEEPSKNMFKYWACKIDQSLPRGGVELASCPLTGTEGLDLAEEVCQYAIRNGWTVDARAAFHLHVDLGADTGKIDNVLAGFMETYELWLAMVAESRASNRYCLPWTIHRGLLYAYKDKTPGALYKDLLNPPRGLDPRNARRVWVNPHSVRKFNTIENRLHQGTLNHAKLRAWVAANVRFVEWCLKQDNLLAVTKNFDALDTMKKRFRFLVEEVWKDAELGEYFTRRAALLHPNGSAITSTKKLPAAAKAAVLEVPPAPTTATAVWTVAEAILHQNNLGDRVVFVDQPDDDDEHDDDEHDDDN